jgi:hypothetical protein
VRDCADEVCVAGAIMNYTSQLSSTSGDQQTDALMFVVHFIGDIHQPLHVAFVSDKGGNTYEGSFFGQATNLHQVWDSGIITMRTNNDFNGYQDLYTKYLLAQIQGEWANDAKVWANCTNAPACPFVWANEAASLACTRAYVDTLGHRITSGFNLSWPYFAGNTAIVDRQLARAGVRLATSLNLVLGGSAGGAPMGTERGRQVDDLA